MGISPEKRWLEIVSPVVDIRDSREIAFNLKTGWSICKRHRGVKECIKTSSSASQGSKVGVGRSAMSL